MKKAGVWLLWLGALVWGLFVFLASNGPDDVQHRTSGWLSVPLVRDLPAATINFAARPVVLAASFLFLGVFLGWRLTKWGQRRRSGNAWEVLGIEMSLLALEIDDAHLTSDLHRLNASINLLRVKARRRGLAFPVPVPGKSNVRELLPYLTQVSAYLKAGEIDHARDAARQLAAPSGSPA